jgi:hypothetical protein
MSFGEALDPRRGAIAFDRSVVSVYGALATFASVFGASKSINQETWFSDYLFGSEAC